MLMLQIAYLLYAIFIRSFERIKDQVIEVLNEFVLLILIIFITKYPFESDWDKTSVDALIGIVLSQLWILLLVSIVNATIQLLRYIKKIKNKENSANSIDEISKNANEVDGKSINIAIASEGQEVVILKEEQEVVDYPCRTNQWFSWGKPQTYIRHEYSSVNLGEDYQNQVFEEDKIEHREG